MTSLIITACILGFVYSAAPGAVNTEALRRGLKRGFMPAFSVETGALLGDLLWAVVGLTGVALVFHFLAVQIILGIAGAAFLLRMAWMSFLDARKPIDLNQSGTKEQRDFLTGIVFSIANPFGIAFWGGIGGGFAARITVMPLMDKLVILFVGFAAGAFAWCVGISLLVAWSRKFIGEKLLRGIFTLSSLAMAYFALEMLWSLIHSTISPMFSTRTQLKITK
ncbi:LysE family transporter [Bacillus salipaludis]|uniref:LysE family transporter n=1 Tax=Bacillus salipaludis TaxID=2547811 RepID=UPI002E23921E|nr:LysE family transporter [Bacillus salipaludis]